MRRRLFRLSAVLLVLLLGAAAAACSSDDDSGSGSTDDSTEAAGGDETTTTEAAEVLRILVTDDDGIDGPGYIALVEALQEVEDVELTLSAPAENQSGSSDSTTVGEVTSTETEVAGLPATAVDGFPADAVVAAIEAAPDGARSFDLVMSGINAGQNVGSLEQLSGTVGAARTGARNGIDAFAISQGLTMDDSVEPDFATSAELAVEWLEENRQEILETPIADGEAGFLFSMNVPTCVTGELRGVYETDEGGVDLAGRETSTGDCTSTAEPTDEVDAFIQGYAPLVPLPAD